MSAIDNGVNVQALLTRAKRWRGTGGRPVHLAGISKWENGVHSTTSIQNFFGLGEEQSHKTEAVFDADHPEVFAASDNGSPD
jgi:hypothetical protein